MTCLQALKAVSVSGVLIASLTGVVACVTIPPFSILATLILLLAAARIALRRLRDTMPSAAISNLLAMGLVFGGIIAFAASYRPAKTTEHQLRKQLSFPSAEMSLADLAEALKHERQSYPMHISLRIADSQKDQVVRWPCPNVSVAEFLAAIESQTTLRGSFRHCGNGYTVLYGGDCCFGLVIRDEPRSGGIH